MIGYSVGEFLNPHPNDAVFYDLETAKKNAKQWSDSTRGKNAFSSMARSLNRNDIRRQSRR